MSEKAGRTIHHKASSHAKYHLISCYFIIALQVRKLQLRWANLLIPIIPIWISYHGLRSPP